MRNQWMIDRYNEIHSFAYDEFAKGTPHTEVAAMVLEWLQRHGLTLKDFEDWKNGK